MSGSAEMDGMDDNAYCLWCKNSYAAAKPPATTSAGICWDCIQLVFPGNLNAADREKLYGNPATPPPHRDLDPGHAP